MRRFVGFLLLLVLVAVAFYWYRSGSDAAEMGRELKQGARKAVDWAKGVVNKAPEIDAEKIQDELVRTGRVVRRKAGQLSEKVGEVASDARTTTAIKLKYAADPNLSAWAISVDTTAGRVTLAGTVSSPEHIETAIRLALAENGVHEVVSTLQLDPRANPGTARPPVTTRRRSS